MRFSRKSRVGAAVPTASMADIAFLLLVFFMVSTVFIRFRGIPVSLPEAERIEKLEMRRHVTSIWIGANGAVNIDDRAVALEEVGPPDPRQADREPPPDHLHQGRRPGGVRHHLRRAAGAAQVEALRVNFATDREDGAAMRAGG